MGHDGNLPPPFRICQGRVVYVVELGIFVAAAHRGMYIRSWDFCDLPPLSLHGRLDRIFHFPLFKNNSPIVWSIFLPKRGMLVEQVSRGIRYSRSIFRHYSGLLSLLLTMAGVPLAGRVNCVRSTPWSSDPACAMGWKKAGRQTCR